MQRNTRRTASPPSKMIAEGKRGRRFYERLPRTVLNLLQYADGLKDGGGGFNALVSGLGARAFDGLLDVVRGQQAEAHRHAAFERHMGKALGGFGRHEIKMRRPAPDDGADGDDAVVFAGGRQLLAGEGHFEGAGNADDGQVFL